METAEGAPHRDQPRKPVRTFLRLMATAVIVLTLGLAPLWLSLAPALFLRNYAVIGWYVTIFYGIPASIFTFGNSFFVASKILNKREGAPREPGEIPSWVISTVLLYGAILGIPILWLLLA